MDRLRRHIDLPLFLIAIVFALPTFAYAFGRDQATFHYVAREWLHGRLPYSETLDNKPPLIFTVHLLTALVAGGSQWGIRALDVCGLLGMAILLARALPGRAPRGTAGVLAVLLVGFYVTAFDYWMSAQVELWEGLLLLGAWVAVERIDRPDRRAAISGLLLALAFLGKLPAVVVAVVITARLCLHAFRERRWPGLARALAVHVLAGIATLALVVLYWAAHGAARDLWEVVVEFNRGYATNARDWPTSWVWTKDWFTRSLYYPTFLGLWIAGVVVAARARDRATLAQLAWAGALLVASLGSVVLQRKFFAYHWCVSLPFTVLGATYAVARAVARWPLATAAAALLVLVAGFLYAPGWNVESVWTYRNYTALFLRYERGQSSREEFLRPFNQRGHQYGDMEAVSLQMRDLARPGDTVCVEGYEPAFYVISGLRCSHRFFATNYLTDPRGRFPMLPRWKDEHRRAMTAHPPSFTVERDEQTVRKKGCRPVFHHGIWWLGDCRPEPPKTP